MHPQRKARHRPSASRRTSSPPHGKAPLRGSPCSRGVKGCSSKNANVARAARKARRRGRPHSRRGAKGCSSRDGTVAPARKVPLQVLRHPPLALRKANCATKASAINATCGRADPAPPRQTHRARRVKHRVFRRPEHPVSAGRPMRRPDLSSAVGRKAAGPKSAEGRQGIYLRASRAPAPVARRQAAARAAANAICATARRSPLLRLRKSRAAASGREAKVRGRGVRAWAASVSVEQVSGLVQPLSGLVRPRRPSVRPSALLPRPRASSPRALRKGRDRNRQQLARPLVVCRLPLLRGDGPKSARA